MIDGVALVVCNAAMRFDSGNSFEKHVIGWSG